MEIHKKKAELDYHRLKTMVKRSIEQNLRLKNSEARNGNFETSAVVKNQRAKQREQRSLGDCWQWNANKQCSKWDNCSFRHDINKRAKTTQPNPAPRSSTQQSVKNAPRTRSLRGRSPSGRMSRLPCKDYIKGTCTTPFCEKWHPPECLFYKSENGCRFGENFSYAHRQVDELPSERSERMVTKVQWLCWKLHDNWVAYFKIWSRRSLHRFCGRAQTHWSQSDVFNSLTPCYVTPTFETRIHRLEWFAQVNLISVTPNAPKFEDRSQEETERQERFAREATWRLATNILKWNEKHKAAFFSPSENRCLPAPSTLKPEEREFVVDSGASMHLISKKGFQFR